MNQFIRTTTNWLAAECALHTTHRKYDEMLHLEPPHGCRRSQGTLPLRSTSKYDGCY